MRGECIARLTALGIGHQDAVQLRRISMTLHRWHELECGDSNDFASWCIVRGTRNKEVLAGGGTRYTFEYCEDGENGKPYLERHDNSSNRVTYHPTPDRERGAQKRLATIMARYPDYVAYVQGDPRGAALYILERATTPQPYEQFYSRGVAVYR